MKNVVLEVNLRNLRSNFNYIQEKVGDAQILSVVKSDAYGIGLEQVVYALSQAGARYFVVDCIEEAIRVKKIANLAEVLVLKSFTINELKPLLQYRFIPSISSYQEAKQLNFFAFNQNAVIDVHIKVDTGMGRVGELYYHFLEVLPKWLELKNIRITGILSHLSCAYLDDSNSNEFTQRQIVRFQRCIHYLQQSFENIVLMQHLANSGGILRFPESHFNAVRPGIILYGILPFENQLVNDDSISLSKIVQLKTKIIALKKIRIGESVSYGRSFVAKRNMKIAVLDAGYADGYSSRLSNQGRVLISGHLVNIIGRVCMNYMMCDITDFPNIYIGDEAILIGQGITEEHLARQIEINPYEILTGISSRVSRIYVS